MQSVGGKYSPCFAEIPTIHDYSLERSLSCCERNSCWFMLFELLFSITLRVGGIYFPQISQIITDKRISVNQCNPWEVILLFVAILIVNAYQATAEGEYFAKGDEDGVVNLCQRWADEACG